jgi:V-type H+-transporting ATPase proteolipid subunit
VQLLQLFLQVTDKYFLILDLGSAYGTAKAGVGVAHLGMIKHQLLMKGVVPCIMAGILGIYGLIVSVIIAGTINAKAGYSSYKGYSHLAAGLSVGLSALAAGMSIGIVGDAGVRAYGKQEKVYVVLILVLIFAEALALYGLIVGLVVANLSNQPTCPTVG